MKKCIYFVEKTIMSDSSLIDKTIDSCVSFNEENAIFDIEPCSNAIIEEIMNKGVKRDEIEKILSKDKKKCIIFSSKVNRHYKLEVKRAMWKG